MAHGFLLSILHGVTKEKTWDDAKTVTHNKTYLAFFVLTLFLMRLNQTTAHYHTNFCPLWHNKPCLFPLPFTMTEPHSLTPTIKFCSQCGSAIEYRIPPDDSRLRAVCTVCTTVHYDNPKCVVGTIPFLGDKILLCKRAIEPGYGMWTLPAGFMECGESLAQGAARETFEEACATVDLIEPVYSLVDIPHIGQIHIFFRAQLRDHDFAAGHETLAVALFAHDEIPWQDLAFNSVRVTLQSFIADAERAEFTTHHHVRTLTSS